MQRQCLRNISDRYGCKMVVSQIVNLRLAETLAILSKETEYAQEIKSSFMTMARSKELDIPWAEDFSPDTLDFGSLLERLRTRRIDALFINAQSEASFHAILKRVREIKLDVSLYGAYWPGSPALLGKAKQDLEGVVYFDTPSLRDILRPEGQGIYQEFNSRYGKPRSIEAAFATTFEAFRALTAAIESGRDIRDFLYHEKFMGIFGPYHFDANGEIVGISFVLKEIRNGEVRTISSPVV